MIKRLLCYSWSINFALANKWRREFYIIFTQACEWNLQQWRKGWLRQLCNIRSSEPAVLASSFLWLISEMTANDAVLWVLIPFLAKVLIYLVLLAPVWIKSNCSQDLMMRKMLDLILSEEDDVPLYKPVYGSGTNCFITELIRPAAWQPDLLVHTRD